MRFSGAALLALPATVPVVVQPGGAGGAPVTTNSTNGNPGASISTLLTSFGTYLLGSRVYGSPSGVGGTTAAQTPLAGPVTAYPGSTGGSTSLTADATQPLNATRGASGGAPGGSISAADVLYAGSRGAGLPAVAYGVVGPSPGGAAGVSSSVAGAAGLDLSPGMGCGDPGGGGGYPSKTATAAGAGGNGGWLGGAGAGGGAGPTIWRPAVRVATGRMGW